MPDELKFSREYETGVNYIVIEPPVKVHIFEYQIEMLANNPVSTILCPEIRRKDECTRFYFDVSSRATLNEYLKNKKLAKRDFIDLLMRIADIMLQGKELLLNERNFILNEDYIMADTESGQLQLIYMPIHMEGMELYLLKDCVINLITRTAVFEVKNGDNYLHRIIEHAKTSTFTSVSLKRLLNDIKYKEMYAAQKSGGQEKLPEIPVLEETGSRSNAWDLFIDDKSNAENREQISMRKLFEDIGDLDFKTVISTVLFQVALIVFAVGIEGLMKDKDLPADTRYISLGVFLLAADLLFFKYFVMKKKGTGDEAGKAAEEDIRPESFMEPNVQYGYNVKEKSDFQTEHTLNSDFIDLNTARRIEKSEDIVKSERDEAVCDETTLLNTCSKLEAFLQGEDDELKQRCYITGDRFVIGRSSDISNLCINKKVIGRVHAEIVVREKHYYIIDKSSRNGTYVNSEQLAAELEHELMHNDEITFANVRYRFYKF